MFTYSGSKARFQKYLPALPVDADVVVEPFAGALAYSSLKQPPRVVWAEAAPKVHELLLHLASEATPESLEWITQSQPTENIDCYDHQEQYNLSDAETTLVRLYGSGLYVGQLSSRVLYPQHRLNLRRTKTALAWFQAAHQAGYHDYRDVPVEYRESQTAWWCIDPPYLNTSANYQSKKGQGNHNVFDPDQFREWFATLRCRGFVLYGDGCQSLLPDLTWTKYTERKTSRGRAGGTKVRTENIAFFDRRSI